MEMKKLEIFRPVLTAKTILSVICHINTFIITALDLCQVSDAQAHGGMRGPAAAAGGGRRAARLSRSWATAGTATTTSRHLDPTRTATSMGSQVPSCRCGCGTSGIEQLGSRTGLCPGGMATNYGISTPSVLASPEYESSPLSIWSCRTCTHLFHTMVRRLPVGIPESSPSPAVFPGALPGGRAHLWRRNKSPVVQLWGQGRHADPRPLPSLSSAVFRATLVPRGYLPKYLVPRFRKDRWRLPGSPPVLERHSLRSMRAFELQDLAAGGYLGSQASQDLQDLQDRDLGIR